MKQARTRHEPRTWWRSFVRSLYSSYCSLRLSLCTPRWIASDIVARANGPPRGVAIGWRWRARPVRGMRGIVAPDRQCRWAAMPLGPAWQCPFKLPAWTLRGPRSARRPLSRRPGRPRNPRCPVIGVYFPDPGKIGIPDFPNPGFRPNRDSRFPESRIPAKSDH
jgi:hypothetical protein